MNVDQEEVVLAEKAVVGSCIFTPPLVRSVVQHVSPDDFGDKRLGAMFGLVLGMVSAHGPDSVTPITVAEEARRRNAEKDDPNRRGAPRVILLDMADIAALVTHGIAGRVEEHAKVVATAALGRRLSAFGVGIVTDIDQGIDPTQLLGGLGDRLRKISDEHRMSGLNSQPLADVLADHSLNDYEWVVPGLLEAGDRLIITGGEGAGKSMLLRQLALCAGAGVHPFTARAVPAKRVLVVDAENSKRQWHRKSRGAATAISRLADKPAAHGVHLACVSRRDLTSARHLGDIHAEIDEIKPDILFIGPLYKMVPNAINNDSEAAPLINALDSIHDRGLTLVMEAHAGKGLGEGGMRNFAPRGSAALLGWPEFGFGLAPDSNDKTRVDIVRWRGDRDERDWPNRLRRGGVMPWTDDRRPLSQEEQEAHYRIERKDVD